jgi:hypothetical protein
MMGPLAGWASVELYEFPSALQLLVPATMGSLLPLLAYLVTRYRPATYVGTAFWFASGYLFCVAIWI